MGRQFWLVEGQPIVFLGQLVSAFFKGILGGKHLLGK
jgi:hypothetical protein